MISLPKPYEDELLYSVLARAVAYLAPEHDFAVRRVLGGTYLSVLFGPPVHALLGQNTDAIWGLSARDIVYRHTMFPLYDRFVPPVVRTKCLDMIISGGLGSVATCLGLQQQSNVNTPVFLKFCRSCALNDLSAYGETFWRRSNQFSGALVCVFHSEVLRISGAEMFSKAHRPQDATAFIDVEAAPECASLTSAERAMAKRIAIRCIEFLQGNPTRWDHAVARIEYRRSAISTGYFEGSGQHISYPPLISEFIEFFGLELLKKIGCNDNLDPNSSWLRKMLQLAKAGRYHPLLHALVQLFLEEKEATRLRSRDTSATSGVSSEVNKWKCPNPYAPHDDQFQIPAVDRRWKLGGTYLRARCSCGYGFSFKHGTAEDPLLPRVNKVFAWGPYFVLEAKRLKNDGLSTRRIASQLNLSHAVAKRLVKGKMNKFEHSEKEIHALRGEWFRTRSKSVRDKLFQYDRAWLTTQERGVSRGGKGRPKNWHKLDQVWAPLVRAAIGRLRANYPDRKISYLALEQECRIKSLRKKARKLPKCHAILSKASVGWSNGRPSAKTICRQKAAGTH